MLRGAAGAEEAQARKLHVQALPTAHTLKAVDGGSVLLSCSIIISKPHKQLAHIPSHQIRAFPTTLTS